MTSCLIGFLKYQCKRQPLDHNSNERGNFFPPPPGFVPCNREPLCYQWAMLVTGFLLPVFCSANMNNGWTRPGCNLFSVSVSCLSLCMIPKVTPEIEEVHRQVWLHLLTVFFLESRSFGGYPIPHYFTTSPYCIFWQ